MECLSAEDTQRPSTLGQVVPVTRRLLKTFQRKWISSLINLVVSPCLVLAIFTYILHYMSNNKDFETSVSETFIGLVMFMSTVGMAQNFVMLLVVDKQTNFRALLITMGLRKVSYYMGTFLIFLALILIPTLISCTVSLIYQFQGILVSRIWIVVIYLLFAIHLVGFIFAFSSLITSTSFITIFYIPLIAQLFIHALVIWAVSNTRGELASWLLFLASASPYESLKIFGDSYSKCHNCDVTDGNFYQVSQPVYLIVMAMCFWTILAFAFGFWFEEICPWKNDSEVKKPLFCFKRKSKFSSNQHSSSPNLNSKYFEKRTVSLTDIGISLNGLTKLYNNIPVVNNLTLNIFKGETTLLLGHNGAGKTTLMNMILGKLCPDEGKIFIRKSSSNYVESGTQGYGIGVCPQTSILDENLTVLQHLELLYSIKTSSSQRTRRLAIQETISNLRLNTHSHCYISQLSGGMKRKLSLGMALIGKSDILILDEPSSGLDPDSRMLVWDIIKRYRGTRTVLLSTQHMEEADYLGDRIVIMSKGTIICCGSSIFLNNTFNSGYKLRVDCLASKKKQILEFVQTHFRSAKLSDADQLNSFSQQEDQVQDMVIELGDMNQDSEKKLIALLESIESKSEILHIRSHGLKSSSIEDVMLKTSNLDLETPQSASHIDIASTHRLIDKLTTTPIDKAQSSFIKALLMKFLHIYKNNWKTILFYRLLLPALLIWSNIRTFTFDRSFSPGIINSMYIVHFIALPVAERVTSFKTVQLSSAATQWNYWISFFLVDLISAGVITILMNLLYATSFTGIYLSSGFIIHSLLSLATLMFIIAAILFAYVVSFFFNDSKNSIGYFILLHLVPAFVSILVLILVLTLGKNVMVISYTQLAFIFFYPSIAFEYIIFGFGTDCILYPIAACSVTEPALGISPIVLGFVVLFLQIVVYASLLSYFEYARLNISNWSLFSLCRKKPQPKQSQLRPIDEDVNQESKKINQIIHNVPRIEYVLVANDLAKSYVKGTKVVDHLSFSVKRRECFGLLGVNGAGKSTTFSMVVGDFKQDTGIIWLNGLYNSSNIDLYRKSIGYDPQSEPDFSLSPVEALTLMARLRMVKEEYIPELVESVLSLLEMSEHSNKITENLSGGTKRKLALGMSLIGNPKLLALDEPTAGVDPMARRNIWNLLKSLRNRNDSSVLISSHAMEECEAICDRIGVMASGRLRCIGSFLQLRTKFVRGCRVKIQFNQSSDNTTTTKLPIEGMTSEIASELSNVLNCEVKISDINMSSAILSVTSTDFKRSKILTILRKSKKKFSGITYVINDPSLEDIFITIAQEESGESISRPSVAQV